VPTWAPFGLQIYCSGHSALTRSLTREGIEFAQEDNAFLRIADLARAQALADGFAQDDWHWMVSPSAVALQQAISQLVGLQELQPRPALQVS